MMVLTNRNLDVGCERPFILSLKFCCALLLFVAGFVTARADILPPTLHEPTTVKVDMWIEDINDISLSSGTYNITAQFAMRWHDPRLAFSSKVNAPHIWMGSRAEEQLHKIWHPIIDVYGERGLSSTKVYFLEIWPDGQVELRQKFTAHPRFYGDLLFFPFGSIDLFLSLASVAMDNQQVRFELETLTPSKSLDELSEILHGNWYPEQVYWSLSEQGGFAHTDRIFPQIDLSIKIQHDFHDGVQKILLPLIVIALASWGLLWLDMTYESAYTSARIGGTTTLILTTIALKFVLTRELPVVHYFTLSDVLFNTTIIMLSISLMVSCMMVKKLAEDRRSSARRLNVAFRRSYFFIYMLLFALMMPFFIG